MTEKPGDIWVFGYGSLMWNPQFNHLDMAPALLRGYHRSFCVYSHVWRGTIERPGLVLGLDCGGSCKGQAFHVAAADAAQVLDYLDKRERVTEVYVRRTVPVMVTRARDRAKDRARDRANGGAVRVMAETYVVDRTHHQYAGKLAAAKAASLILQASGVSGPNHEYLASTVRHLDGMGIKESPLHEIDERVRGLRAAGIKAGIKD